MTTSAPTRSVGALGATVLLVGFVIGISIFILPGTLAVTAGPAVILSYLFASVLAIFSCVIAAQIGVAFPVSGGSFVAISRLLSPLWGFLAIWLIIGAGAVAVSLLAYGFADYAATLWPALHRSGTALALVLALGILNLLGIRDTVLGQGVMVALFMTALVIFCVAGLANIDVGNLRPFMPNGLEPVVLAAIPAFFSFSGFMIIVEIGGEVRDPQRNVPKALGLSFAIVLTTYILVALTIVGVVPWSDLAGAQAPVVHVASKIMPSPVVLGITLTALAAAASSVNILLLGYSRDLYALAKSSVLPGQLARLSGKSGEPRNCVILFAVIALAAVAAGGTIAEVATLTVIGLLLLQIALGLAAVRMPRVLGDEFQRLGFRLSGVALKLFGVGLMTISAAFLMVVVLDRPVLVIVATVYVGIGLAYFFLRRRWLHNRDRRLEQLIASNWSDFGH